jgi:hypothetical protein
VGAVEVRGARGTRSGWEGGAQRGVGGRLL